MYPSLDQLKQLKTHASFQVLDSIIVLDPHNLNNIIKYIHSVFTQESLAYILHTQMKTELEKINDEILSASIS